MTDISFFSIPEKRYSLISCLKLSSIGEVYLMLSDRERLQRVEPTQDAVHVLLETNQRHRYLFVHLRSEHRVLARVLSSARRSSRHRQYPLTTLVWPWRGTWTTHRQYSETSLIRPPYSDTLGKFVLNGQVLPLSRLIYIKFTEKRLLLVGLIIEVVISNDESFRQGSIVLPVNISLRKA